MIRNFGAVWARGSDGAPAHAWVARSAAFAVVLAVWSQWGGLITHWFTGFGPTDLLLGKSTTILLALYLAWAARTRARAATAVIVLAASAIGTEVYGRVSSQWLIDLMNEPGYAGPGAAHRVVAIAGICLTTVPYWAAWGIARRRTRWWAVTAPLPALSAVAVQFGVAAYLDAQTTLDDVSDLPMWLMYVGGVVAPVLVAWAVDTVAWRRAGSPEWTERISDTPRPPDPLLG